MSSSLQKQQPQKLSHSKSKYLRYGYRTSWLNFVKIAVISVIPFILLSYFLPNLMGLLIYWLIAFLVWGIWRIKRMKKVQKLDEFQFPSYIWTVFHQQYPQFRVINQPYIEEAFKDYLALHIIKNQPYAMPSHAVDALWHLLLEQFSEFYRQMCQDILGFELMHKAHQTSANRMQKRMQNRQLLNTWVMSCCLHQMDQRQPKEIPRLFFADEVVTWDHGFIFNMAMITILFQQFHAQGQSTISLTSSSSDTSNADSSSDHSHTADSNDSSSSCSSCSSCGSSGD